MSIILENTPDTRDTDYVLTGITRITCVTFFISICLSWRLYLSDHRLFSFAPAIDVFASAPKTLNILLLYVLVSCLGWLCADPRQRVPAYGVILCIVFFILQDLMRLQPYTYMYIGTIFLAGFYSQGKTAIAALRIMVIGVYFWAGFHKFNVTFCYDIFPWFIAPIYPFPVSQSWGALIVAGLVPLFEMMIGVLLCYRRLWGIASIMACIMLVVVLFCLGPSGHNWNSIVWPWNMYLFVLELFLFYMPTIQPAGTVTMNDHKFMGWMPSMTDKKGLIVGTILLFVVMPVFSMVQLWPAYLGFKLYSGNTSTADIYFDARESLLRLPEEYRTRFDPHYPMGLLSWTAFESNTIVPPQEYIFRKGASGLCPYLDYSAQARLRIYDPPPFYTTKRTYKEVPLCS